MLPLVAIVGRPNVGKSSLFNRLVGKPISIVDPTAGVTRDRILHDVRRDGAHFQLVDTGGIGIVDEAKLEADVERQIDRAIEHADRILFICDGRDGILPLDQEIAARLRPFRDRVTLLVNKIDHENLEANIHEFQALGVSDDPLPVSAEQARGLHDLVERLAEDFPDQGDEEPENDGRLKVCLAGRRNVGKSSLTNCLCGEERVIVADYAGTTRDAVDIPIDHESGSFTLIDTAGLRKKRQLTQDLEFYAACRTERGIKRADVVLLVLDASDEVGMVDKKIAHYCEVEGKPTILVINKWDIAESGGATRDQYETWLRDRLPGLRHAPMLYTCALNGLNVEEMLRLATELDQENHERVGTSELNEILEAAVARRRPRKVGPSSTKIFYATQADVAPPTFIVFVNRTDWIEPGYHRYLENFFRRHLTFRRVPYRIMFKARSSQYHEHADQRVRTDALTKGERNARLLVPKSSKRKRQQLPRRMGGKNKK